MNTPRDPTLVITGKVTRKVERSLKKLDRAYRKRNLLYTLKVGPRGEGLEVRLEAKQIDEPERSTIAQEVQESFERLGYQSDGEGLLNGSATYLFTK